MDVEEYKRLRDMINDALDCGRPIERNIGGEWKPLEVLGVVTAQLRVQPAPLQKKYRPMNKAELEQEVRRRTVVEGVTLPDREDVIGTLGLIGMRFVVCGLAVCTDRLVYADPAHPNYGQPLQVEIKDAPQ